MVVYAGYDFENVPATFAYAFEAKVGGPEDVNNYQKLVTSLTPHPVSFSAKRTSS